MWIGRKMVAVIVGMALLLGGCDSMNIYPQSSESVRDELLDYLNNKYNKEFVALSMDRGHTDILFCYAHGGEPKTDLVKAQRDVRDNGVEFKDTYFGIIIREDMENEIKTICSEIDVPLQVFYSSDTLYYDNFFGGSKNYSDLKEWIEDGNAWLFTISLVIALDDIEKAEAYSIRIFDKLTMAGFRGLAQLDVITPEGFEKLNRINLSEIKKEYGFQNTVFSKIIN